jgi:hypothetical protein
LWLRCCVLLIRGSQVRILAGAPTAGGTHSDQACWQSIFLWKAVGMTLGISAG